MHVQYKGKVATVHKKHMQMLQTLKLLGKRGSPATGQRRSLSVNAKVVSYCVETAAATSPPGYKAHYTMRHVLVSLQCYHSVTNCSLCKPLTQQSACVDRKRYITKSTFDLCWTMYRIYFNYVYRTAQLDVAVSRYIYKLNQTDHLCQVITSLHTHE
jgi:hypothetical protein